MCHWKRDSAKGHLIPTCRLPTHPTPSPITEKLPEKGKTSAQDVIELRPKAGRDVVLLEPSARVAEASLDERAQRNCLVCNGSCKSAPRLPTLALLTLSASHHTSLYVSAESESVAAGRNT